MKRLWKWLTTEHEIGCEWLWLSYTAFEDVRFGIGCIAVSEVGVVTWLGFGPLLLEFRS